MGGVRLVAGVFALLGWIAVVVGSLAAIGMFAALSSSMRPGSNMMSVAGAAMPLITTLLASLGPFFLWAILRVLIEIHDELKRDARQRAPSEPPAAAPTA